MTSEQIQLIQQSFEKVAPQAEMVATIFYESLFSLEPSLRLMFPEDLTEQKKKLMTMLGMAIKSLTKPDVLVPVLEDLGRRHAHYNVREEHYETVGAALISTLSRGLGAEFTSEIRAAWIEMYGFVAATMKRAAREVPLPAIKPEANFMPTGQSSEISSVAQ
jgi:hemoglobin-like flavoprotein